MKQKFQETDRKVCGEQTIAEYKNIFCGDIFDWETFSLEELRASVNLDDRPDFFMGVREQLCKLGTYVDRSDPEQMLREVKMRYLARTGEICPRTIQEWFRGTAPGGTNRKNNYLLCYALEMNLQETAEFFRKYYLTVPFCCKDRIDAVFFYCLSHDRPYEVMKDMLDTAKQFETQPESGTKTAQIAGFIADTEDDKQFLAYMSRHCYDKRRQYQSSRKRICALLERHKTSSVAELHQNVMGFHYQDAILTKQKRRYDLPEEFLRSLPTDRTFIDIQKGKQETYETLRKTLIILLFYDFYMEAQQAEIDPENSQIRENLLDFYEGTNEILKECGLVPLYVRHPFDKLILRCAASKYPLETFYGLNDLRYFEA